MTSRDQRGGTEESLSHVGFRPARDGSDHLNPTSIFRVNVSASAVVPAPAHLGQAALFPVPSLCSQTFYIWARPFLTVLVLSQCHRIWLSATSSGASPAPTYRLSLFATGTAQRLKEKMKTCTSCLGLRADSDPSLILLNVMF